MKIKIKVIVTVFPFKRSVSVVMRMPRPPDLRNHWDITEIYDSVDREAVLQIRSMIFVANDKVWKLQKGLDKTDNTVYTVHIQKCRWGVGLNIHIDNKSGAPIYDQIYSQIKAQIINGTLKEDTPLPSIRNLAKDLRISVITTKRAYDELEKEGFIYTVAAKGCFVAPMNIELLREVNLKKIEEYMEEITRLAQACNLTRQEIIEMFDYIMGE